MKGGGSTLSLPKRIGGNERGRGRSSPRPPQVLRLDTHRSVIIFPRLQRCNSPQAPCEVEGPINIPSQSRMTEMRAGCPACPCGHSLVVGRGIHFAA